MRRRSLWQLPFPVADEAAARALAATGADGLRAEALRRRNADTGARVKDGRPPAEAGRAHRLVLLPPCMAAAGERDGARRGELKSRNATSVIFYGDHVPSAFSQ